MIAPQNGFTVGDTNAILALARVICDERWRNACAHFLMNVTYEASNIEFGTYKVKQSDGSYKDVTFLVGIVRNFAFDIDATKVIDHKLMSPPALEFNSKPSAILDVLQTDYTPKKLIFETNTITEIPSLFRGTFTRTSGVYNSSPNTKIEVYPRTDELGSSRLRAVSNIVFYVGNSRVATISSLNGFDYTFAVEPKIKDGSNVQNLTIPQTFGSARLSGVSDARTFKQ